MLIALLAVLGVNLIVIVIVLVALLGRRRSLDKEPHTFNGAIRVVDGDVSGLGSTWKRGYGRWIRDVLVWRRAPLLIRSQELAIDGIASEIRSAETGEVKRLGNDLRIISLLAAGGARIEIAAPAQLSQRVLGPLAAPD